MAVRAARIIDDPELSAEVLVLAVGDVFPLAARINADLEGGRTAFADFSDVTHDLVATLAPQVVISSVLGRNFDCVDLAEKLAALGFRGCYRLIGHGIPRPELVVREIRALFPGLHVELDRA